MPQLNPTPWFGFLAYTWLAFLLVIPYLTLTRRIFKTPSLLGTETPKTNSWNWTWQ